MTRMNICASQSTQTAELTMPSLYKYLPSEYVPAVLDRGEILFRNLTYLRQQEGRVRGDAHEEIHEDYPGKNIALESPAPGIRAVER